MNSAMEMSKLFNIRWLSAPLNPHVDLVLLLDNCAQLEETFISLLGPTEKTDLNLKVSNPARRLWLMGRIAAKMAAARYWSLEPSLVEVVTGQKGRPEFSSPLPLAGYVSISHTVGAAASVVGIRPVGIDLEKVDRVINKRTIAWAFNDKELKLLESAQKFPGPLSLWCAREAAAKSWGIGLLNHLSQVRVTGANWPAGHLTVDWLGLGGSLENLGRRAEVQLQVAGEYLVALAT